MKTLHVVVLDPKGRVESQAIGRAISAAAIDEKVTTSALRNGLVALTSYQAYSPKEAAEAMRTLAELGDVDFDERDFLPQWFDPDEGIATTDLVLKRAGRRFSSTVRGELVRLREVLAEARSRGCMFHLVETEPGERLRADMRLRKLVATKRLGDRPAKTPANTALHPTGAGGKVGAGG